MLELKPGDCFSHQTEFAQMLMFEGLQEHASALVIGCGYCRESILPQALRPPTSLWVVRLLNGTNLVNAVSQAILSATCL